MFGRQKETSKFRRLFTLRHDLTSLKTVFMDQSSLFFFLNFNKSLPAQKKKISLHFMKPEGSSRIHISLGSIYYYQHITPRSTMSSLPWGFPLYNMHAFLLLPLHSTSPFGIHLLLPTHLHLGLPCLPFPWGFPLYNMHAFLLLPLRPTSPSILLESSICISSSLLWWRFWHILEWNAGYLIVPFVSCGISFFISIFDASAVNMNGAGERCGGGTQHIVGASYIRYIMK